LRERVPGKVETLKSLSAEFAEVKRSPEPDERRIRELEIEIQNLDTDIVISSRLPEILVGIVYFYWGCGCDSVDVAERLGIKSVHVRQILWRLARTWKRMQNSLDTSTLCPPESSRSGTTGKRNRKMKKQAAKKSAKKVTKKPAAPKAKAQKPTAPESDREKFAARAVALYAKDMNVSQIAQALGYEKNHGQNRVVASLIRAGVYKGTRKATEATAA
jgi:hypothetical protein